jgi:putative lipoprotein
MRRLLLVAFLALPVVAPAPASAATGAITGTVNLEPQRFAPPADAQLEVRLEDTSRADAAAVEVAKITLPVAGQPRPIPFRLEFDAAGIDPTHRYSVRALVTSGGRLIYMSPSAHPVLTQGAGTSVTVNAFLVLRGGGKDTTGAPPAAGLENTYWKLVAIGDVPALPAGRAREASFTLHAADRRLSGSTGCNRLVGTYTLDNGALKLMPGGTTMMACTMELMQQESDFVAVLTMATGYRIAGDALELVNADRVLARFVAVTMK